MFLKRGKMHIKSYEYLFLSIATFLVGLIWLIRWVTGFVPWWPFALILIGCVGFFVAFCRTRMLEKKEQEPKGTPVEK